MQQLRFPSFGRRLYNRRFAGHHPLFAHLWFGNDWQAFWVDQSTDNVAWLAVRPREFEPHRMDWRCLIGCCVTVFDQDNAAGEIGASNERVDGWGMFYRLLCELACYSGPLYFVTHARIYGDHWRPPPYEVEVSRFAMECRWRDAQRRFPVWWSQEADIEHEKKRAAWRNAAGARFGQRATA